MKFFGKSYIQHFTFILVVLLAISCEQDSLIEEESVDSEEQTTSTVDAVEGIVRVKLKSEAATQMSVSLKSGSISSNIESLDSILNSIGALSFKRTFPYCGKFEARTKEKGMHLWYDIVYDTTKISLASVVNQFENLAEVNVTEPIRKIIQPQYYLKKIDPVVISASLKSTYASGEYPFDDTFLSYQWHYYNDGSVTDALEGSDINLFNAWLKQKGNEDVIVAIVDGGIDIDHEDLASNIWGKRC